MSYPLQFDPRLSIAVALGDAAHAFFRSDLGVALLQRAQRDMDEAKAAMVDCTVCELPRLQNRCKIASGVIMYLQEFLEDGDNAEEELAE